MDSDKALLKIGKKRTRILFFISVGIVLCGILWIIWWLGNGTNKTIAPKIYVLAQSSDRGKDAISAYAIDVGKGRIDAIGFGSSFCGVAYESTKHKTLFSCSAGLLYQPYSAIDELTGTIERGLNLTPTSSLRNPVVCERSDSPRAGTCYYGFGAGEYVDGRTLVRARIVIAEGGGTIVKQVIEIPDASVGRLPAKMRIVGNELLVLTAGNPGVEDVVYRLNLLEYSFGRPIHLKMKAIDMAVYEKNLFVSGYIEDPFAPKLRAFDIGTGEQTWDAGKIEDTAGITVSGQMLYQASTKGITAYDLLTMKRSGFVEVPDKRSAFWSIVSLGGKLYVSDPVGMVYEYDAQTLVPERSWETPSVGSSPLFVVPSS
jgi:hypothetical protein